MTPDSSLVPLSDDDVVLLGLLDRWREDTPAVLVAALVTSDGLPRLASGLDNDGVYLAAIASGLLASGKNVGPAIGGGPSAVRQVMVQTVEEILFGMRAAKGTLLVVVASVEADAGLIGHEMATLIGSLSSHLDTASRTPAGGQ